MTDTPEGDNRIKALANYLERVEDLVEQRKGINADIAEVKSLAVADGYDRTAIADMLALRKMDPEKRVERERFRDLYASKLGLI